ncbi:hypothetical protein [Inquilinus sp. CA228]|uniref:hypothetical protein n=1 Tax=Inquilinus sp. CA228 TaxID=3455609 RepID=UPI003F8D54E7
MSPAGEADAALVKALEDWRQGDCILAPIQFIEADGLEGGALTVGSWDVPGLVVITQTCDIVNFGPGKESVVVCPLVELSDATLIEVATGRTPRAALLEHPPKPNLAIDLGRMMSLRKEVLATLTRHVGVSTDEARVRLADALQRKHGRFAFPDAFNEHVLNVLKKKIARAHKSSGSPAGKAYRSIRYTRVRGAPNWEAEHVTVGFWFVLHDPSQREVSLSEIDKAVGELLEGLVWPDGFAAERPAYELRTMDEMTAREWNESQLVDWEFISNRSRPESAGS